MQAFPPVACMRGEGLLEERQAATCYLLKHRAVPVPTSRLSWGEASVPTSRVSWREAMHMEAHERHGALRSWGRGMAMQTRLYEMKPREFLAKHSNFLLERFPSGGSPLEVLKQRLDGL